jgi:hypothetical protein
MELPQMSLMKPLPTRTIDSHRDCNRSGRRHTAWGRRNSRPRLEFLEERTLLSIDIVGNSNDSGAGSLRDAIANANPGDTIEFDMSPGHVTSPITLTTGELSISQNLKIVGPGPSELTISGNSASTIFGIANGVNATLSGMTLANGQSASSAGGIYNLGHLTLTDDVLSNNTGALAGGIFSESGQLSMSDCRLTLNSANSASGGGIYVLSSAVTIKNSTFDSNNATFFGGAIFNNSGAVSLINSTFTSNSAQEGGGIDNYGGMTMINCTVADNSSQNDGGGINNDVSGTMTLANTIIADNSASVVGPDYNGAVTSDSGNNLIGDESGSTGFSTPSDLLNTNPQLAPLKDNGGPTPTMGLLPGSPAIDAGNNSLVPGGIVTDERGFYRFVNGTTDIGAFEVQSFVVTDTADHGAGSLRTAMTNANLAGGSTILFATSGTITLQSALPAISSDVSMVGPGANTLSLSGNGLNQVFDIQNTATAAISGLTITDGSSGSNGGGIENDGTLALTNCTVSDSSASGGGGGIDNTGTLTLTASTVSGNTSANDAGGIENTGTLVLVDSTIAGNSANSGVGGGINNAGAMTSINSTIADNSAFNGGGIENGGPTVFGNTIIAYNTLTGGSGPDYDGAVSTDSGNNLIGNSSGSSGFAQISDLLDVDPLLSTLGFYGGTTETLTLLPGSPAIDAGSNALAVVGGNPLATDQRGFNRIINAVTDIGAVESHPFTITILFGNNQQTAANTNFGTSLSVLVTSGFFEPVFGGVVTYTAPGSGASATFPGGNKAFINIIGLASVSAKANTVAGGYSIAASTRGASSVNFSVTNTAAAASQLAIHTQPSPTAATGVPFSTQPVIYVLDQYGNLVTTDNTTQVSAASLPMGSGPLQGTTTVTASGGIATFTDLSDNVPETITIQFTSSPVLTSATSNNIVVAAPATQLAIHTQPSPTATAGVAFATQPVVYVEDQYGNLETGDNTTQVTAALGSGTGPLLGTTTVTVSGGIATFTDLSDNLAETITLQFTSSPVLTAATSNNVVISAAAASQLVINTQPSATATAGVDFSTQPVIYVEDQYGNLETGDNTTQVTAASLPIGSGPLQGTTTVTASGGIATFTDLADDKAETITVHFTSSPVLVAATSNNVVISPAAASRLAINTQPSSTATAGVAFGTQPVIYVEDQYGNLETGENTTQVTAASLPIGSGPLQGTTTVTASGGIATFTDLADNTAETITIHFTSSPVLTAATSNNVVISAAAATQLAIQTQPSATATAGDAFATQPTVYVEDQYGNLETGDNTTQVTAALGSGTGPLLGTTTVTVTGGIATVTDLSDNLAETITLQFTSSPVLTAATSNNIVISPAAATQLAIHTQPSATATAGVAFATQPVIYVEDQFGNLETGDSTTQVTAASLPIGSGPLQGTTTVTASGGIATFTDLADNTAETITVHFTSSPVLTAATSGNVVISPAAASQLAINTQPSSAAIAGVAFSSQPVIYVEDQYGNLESSDNTTQVTAASLPIGSGPLQGTTTVTVSGGIATFTDLADNTAETITIQFTSSPVLTAATSNNVVISAAAAIQLAIHTQPSATATAGVAFATQPVIYVEDQYGNLETGDNATQVTAASLPIGSGPLQGTTTVTASGGIATFTNLADDVAETITIHFTSSPVLTAATSSNVVISPAAASQLVINTEPSPTATAGVPFVTQPIVYVEDQYGNLETGDNSTQVTAASLPIGSGPLQGTTTVTASGGIATFTDLSDNLAETITIQFTSSRVLSAVTSNSIVVSPSGVPTKLVVNTQASPTATAGVAFSTQPVIYVEDQYGNLESSDNATQVTVALNSGTGPLLGTTTVTVSGGIATFTDLSDDLAETISLQFTSSPVLTAATSNNIVISAAAATQLVIQTQPSATATAGVAFSTQPVIYVEDQFGNVETGDNTTQVTAASLPMGSGPLQGPTTVTVSSGIAAFTDLADDTAETITIQFTSSPVLTAATSGNVVISPAAASQLAINTQPSSAATAGVAFSTQPVIYVEDQYGNLESSDNTTQVTAASLPIGSGPLQGTTTVTVSGGIATFTDLADNTAETITIQFTSSLVLTAATSNNVVISAAAATQLAIHTQPSPTATAGVAFSTQPIVYVEDQYGNLETSDNVTQVTVALSSGTGPLLGTTTVTVSGGIATFTNLSDNLAETISLQFTSSPVLTAATSNNIVISAAAASQLVINTQPSATATAGVAFGTQPVIYVEDQFGNLETGDNTTQVTAASLPGGSGPLQGTTTVMASGGIATFTDLADDVAETITVQFTSSPVLTAATSSNVVISPAAASQLAINTQPSSAATAGVAFSTQPVIYVEDQYGNLESSDNTTQVTAASLPIGSGPLQGTTTVTVSGGIATFTDLADNTAETITIHFTSSPVLTAATSNNVVISPAAATQLVIQTQPSATATAGVAFSTQPVVYVEDQYSNLETSDNATQVTVALNSGTGPLLGTTTVTVSGGIATFTNLSDNVAETISLQFTSSPVLTAATSSNVVISPAAASQLVINTQPSPTATAGVAFATQPLVYIEDAYGNLITGDNTTQVTAASLPVGSGPLQGTTTVTASGGIATFTDLADNKAETVSLQFSSSPALATATSNNIVISPAAATQLAIHTQPSPGATAGVAFSPQPVVYIEDQYGNLETGDSTTQVSVSLNSGTGPLHGTTTITVSGGIAAFTNLSDNLAETISLQFTSSPILTAATSNNIVISPASASQLVIHTQPSPTATAGVALATQPVIYLEDQYGNLETGDNTTHVTAATLPVGSGPLQGTTTVTASGGIAAFTNLADNKAETISLRFTSAPSLTSAASNNIVVSPAAASQLTVATQPSPTATAGVAFATQPVVYVEDQYGNLITGDNSTQVTAVTYQIGSGPLQGTTTVTASGGIATFTNLADNKAETTSLQFLSLPSLAAAISNSIVISPAAATQLVIHTQPAATATAFVPFHPQPVIYVADQYGNRETGDNSTQVTASLNSGAGPLLGTTTVTVAGGAATFTNLADATAETITLHFTSVPVLSSAVSSAIVVGQQVSYQLVVQTQPSASATAGQPFPAQPVIFVEDQAGNLVVGDNTTQVTVALRVGTGPLLGTTTVTASGGIATFTNLTDDKAESILLIFTAPSLVKAQSNYVTVSAAAATSLRITAPATATPLKPFTVVVTALDPYSNVATSYRGTVHFTSSDHFATLPANYTFTATDAGVHTFGNGVILKTNGHQTVTATDLMYHTVTGSADINVGTVPGFRPAFATGAAEGSAGGKIHDAIAVHTSRPNIRTAHKAHRRPVLVRMERARRRELAALKGNLRVLMMVERLFAGRLD